MMPLSLLQTLGEKIGMVNGGKSNSKNAIKNKKIAIIGMMLVCLIAFSFVPSASAVSIAVLFYDGCDDDYSYDTTKWYFNNPTGYGRAYSGSGRYSMLCLGGVGSSTLTTKETFQADPSFDINISTVLYGYYTFGRLGIASAEDQNASKVEEVSSAIVWSCDLNGHREWVETIVDGAINYSSDTLGTGPNGLHTLRIQGEKVNNGTHIVCSIDGVEKLDTTVNVVFDDEVIIWICSNPGASTWDRLEIHDVSAKFYKVISTIDTAHTFINSTIDIKQVLAWLHFDVFAQSFKLILDHIVITIQSILEGGTEEVEPYDTSQIGFIMRIIPTLLILLVPTLILRSYIGNIATMPTFGFMTVVCYIGGMLPLWIVVIVILAVVAILFKDRISSLGGRG